MQVFVALASIVAAAGAVTLPGGFDALVTDFSCHDRIFGYYADVENECRAYHVCYPIRTENGALVDMAHFSFMCGMNLVFSQDSLTCSHPKEAFPCDQAASLFEASNAKFGIVKDRGDRRRSRIAEEDERDEVEDYDERDD